MGTKNTVMNNLRNNVRLIGNVGAEPIISSVDNGQMARFSMATNESFRNAKGVRVEKVTWHKVVAFGKTAGLIEKFVSTGKEVCVTGKLVHRNYEDTNGQLAYISEIIIHEFFLTGGQNAPVN